MPSLKKRRLGCEMIREKRTKIIEDKIKLKN
jgi:hypothetical protein